MDPTNLLQDSFAESRALQQLIDISYEVNDEEGLPILIQSITNEWAIGINSLCPDNFSTHFSGSLQDLLLQNPQQLKQWFIEI